MEPTVRPPRQRPPPPSDQQALAVVSQRMLRCR